MFRIFRKRKEEPPKENLEDVPMSSRLEHNISEVQKIFENDCTFKIRTFENGQNKAVRCCVFYIEGMVDSTMINDSIIAPVILQDIPQGTVTVDDLSQRFVMVNGVQKSANLMEIAQAILTGDTGLLLDGGKEGLILSTKGWEKRNINEPEAEKVLRGPREGFIESLMVNLTMIRRRLPTTKLKFLYKNIAGTVPTRACLCYIDGVINPLLLQEIEQRLDSIQNSGVTFANTVSEMIQEDHWSPFRTMKDTERPDIVASKLLEGRLAILVEDSPVAITLPHVFMEYFQENDDYYLDYFFATISKIIRIVGFFITICLPAIYMALITFHYEILPTPLLLSIADSRQNVPFPTIAEMALLLAVFELLRESGARIPSNIGQALSILGAVVIGQAAVQAHIASAPMVIIVALTGLTGLMVYRLKGAVIIVRISLLVLSTVLGLYGFILGMICLYFHLASMQSYGVPYLAPATLTNYKGIESPVIRLPWWILAKQKPYFAGKKAYREDIDEE